MISAILSIAFIAIRQPFGTFARFSDVVCGPGFSWAYNTLGQSPCTVAALVQNACLSDERRPLTPHAQYEGAVEEYDTACQCNGVTYMLMSACADCQNAGFENYASWTRSCSTIYPNFLPNGVPPETSVPYWAFTPVPVSNFYDRHLAMKRAELGQPDTTVRSADPTRQAPDPKGVQLKRGAVAGIVVGCLPVLSLIAAAILCCVRRRRRTLQPKFQKVTLYTSPYESWPFSVATMPAQWQSAEQSRNLYLDALTVPPTIKRSVSRLVSPSTRRFANFSRVRDSIDRFNLPLPPTSPFGSYLPSSLRDAPATMGATNKQSVEHSADSATYTKALPRSNLVATSLSTWRIPNSPGDAYDRFDLPLPPSSPFSAYIPPHLCAPQPAVAAGRTSDFVP